jgi:hypothetical protein
MAGAERGGRGVESGGDYRAGDPKPQSLTLSGCFFFTRSAAGPGDLTRCRLRTHFGSRQAPRFSPMGTGAIRVRSGESGVQPLENLPVARSRGNEGRGKTGAGRRRGSFTTAGSTVGAAEI